MRDGKWKEGGSDSSNAERESVHKWPRMSSYPGGRGTGYLSLSLSLGETRERERERKGENERKVFEDFERKSKRETAREKERESERENDGQVNKDRARES